MTISSPLPPRLRSQTEYTAEETGVVSFEVVLPEVVPSEAVLPEVVLEEIASRVS